ncbi:hypothetical protein HYT57_04420 [Candidatus Woesearchaeota archaeon]|nr:hypothetical protein [Candidatus Woesearchaeota archaeon]
MTESHVKEIPIGLENRLDSLERIASSFKKMLSEDSYFGALFLIENLPEKQYDCSSLYSKLAFEIAKELDKSKAPEESVGRSLSEDLLSYLKSRSGEYFKER